MRRIICMWTMSGLLGLSALAWPTPAPAQRRIEPQAVTVQDRWVRIAGIWYRSLEQDGEPGLQTGQR